MTHQLFHLLVGVVVASGAGCGGDGRPPDDNIPPPGNQQETLPLNGPLEGRLFASRWGEYVDLATGQYTQIADGRGDVAIYPSADGTEYVARVQNYRLVPGDECFGSLIRTDRIEIRDIHTNLLRSSFEVYEYLWGIAKLSPDGQAIAVYWDNDCPSESQEYLTVFSRSGEILSQSSEAIREYEWLPDNRLVYAKDKTLFVARTAHRVDGVAIRSLGTMPGYPSRLTPSRDGSRILFEMVTKTPSWLESTTYRDATVWSVSIDGSDLELFATTRREDDPTTDIDDPRVNNPVFSLDGRDVILTEGYFSGLVFIREWYDDDLYEIVSLENTGLMYAVPANEVGIRLPPDGTLPVRVMRSTTAGGDVVPLEQMIISTLALVPRIEPPKEDAGSLPTGTQINRGIGGTLYYVEDENDDTVVRALDIASGQVLTVAKLSDDEYDEFDTYLGVSKDGSYFSFDLHDINGYDIFILDASGAPVATIRIDDERLDFFGEGGIVFSPLNSRMIAVPFDFEFGSFDDHRESVSVWNWEKDVVLKTFTDREYVNPLWTPDGHLLLWDREGGVYRANVSAEEVGDPVLLFRLPEPALYPALSNDGRRLAFSMARHVWTCNMDGSGMTQLTAPTRSGLEVSPVWSPDDQFIMLKLAQDGNSEGPVWIVASDASNVRLGASSTAAVPVSSLDDGHLRRVYGTLNWR